MAEYEDVSVELELQLGIIAIGNAGFWPLQRRTKLRAVGSRKAKWK
jgi:hypothetical protein